MIKHECTIKYCPICQANSEEAAKKQRRINPVRVLNDALHEYRTKHTKMSKDEFYECGCYDAFMWAWQRALKQDDIKKGGAE